MASNAAQSAADTQADAAKQASQVQQQQFQQIQQNLGPYMNAGTTSLGALLGMLGLSTAGISGPSAAQLRQELLPQYTTTTTTGGFPGAPGTPGAATAGTNPRTAFSYLFGDQAMGTSGAGGTPSGLGILPYLNPNPSTGGLLSGQNPQGSFAPQSVSTVDAAGLDAAVKAALAQQGGSAAQLPPGLASLGHLLSTPFSFDSSKLDQTPGYQFSLNQGTKALQNSAAAQGLGLSGAQEKGLLSFATGLADQTYGNQYNRALQQYQTNYGIANDMVNRLSGLASLGQNAAAGVGNAGLSTASTIGGLITGAGNAQAAGMVGSANAINSGLSGLSGNGLLYSLLKNSNSSGGLLPGSTTLYGSDPLGTYGTPAWSYSNNF